MTTLNVYEHKKRASEHEAKSERTESKEKKKEIPNYSYGFFNQLYIELVDRKSEKIEKSWTVPSTNGS